MNISQTNNAINVPRTPANHGVANIAADRGAEASSDSALKKQQLTENVLAQGFIKGLGGGRKTVGGKQNGGNPPAAPNKAAAGNQPKAPTMQNYYQALRSRLRREYNKNGLSLSPDRLKTYAQRFQELSQNPGASPALQRRASFISAFLNLAASAHDTMKAAQSGDPKQFKAALNNHVKNYIALLNARRTLLNPIFMIAPHHPETM